MYDPACIWFVGCANKKPAGGWMVGGGLHGILFETPYVL